MAIKETYRLDYRDYEKFTELLKKTGREAGLTDREIDKMARSFRETGNQAEKAGKKGQKSINNLKKDMGGFGGVVQSVGKQLAAAFALGQFIQLGREIITVTAEFEKLNAVLKNATGSQGSASLYLSTIEQLAAKTPQGVREITQAFVKLNNQGFTPTRNELTKLLDLTNFTGKSFDQLAEAIIDAQVGEFERLKEFGIRAKQSGNQVTFAFQGVETTVQKTDQAIREYLLSLGELQQVQGATAAIAETITGKISNAGDAFDRFFNTIGQGTNGPLSTFLTLVTDSTNALTDFLESDVAKTNRAVADSFNELQESYANTKNVDQLKAKVEEFNAALTEQKAKFDEAVQVRISIQNQEKSLGETVAEGVGLQTSRTEALEKTNAAEEEARVKALAYEQAIRDVNDRIINLTKSSSKLTKEQKKLNEELAEFSRQAAAENAEALLPDQEQVQGLQQVIDGIFTDLETAIEEQGGDEGATSVIDRLFRLDLANLQKNYAQGLQTEEKFLEERFALEGSYLENKIDILKQEFGYTLEIAELEAQLEQRRADEKVRQERRKQEAINLTRDNELELMQVSLQAITQVTSLFGAQGQAIGQFVQQFSSAIQTVIRLSELQRQTSQALTNAKAAEGLAQSAAIPFPANLAAIATFVGALASGFGAVRGLTRQGRKKGGRSDRNVLMRDTNGDGVTGFVHEDEFVFNAQKTGELEDFFEDVHKGGISTLEIKEFHQQKKKGTTASNGGMAAARSGSNEMRLSKSDLKALTRPMVINQVDSKGLSIFVQTETGKSKKMNRWYTR